MIVERRRITSSNPPRTMANQRNRKGRSVQHIRMQDELHDPFPNRGIRYSRVVTSAGGYVMPNYGKLGRP